MDELSSVTLFINISILNLSGLIPILLQQHREGPRAFFWKQSHSQASDRGFPRVAALLRPLRCVCGGEKPKNKPATKRREGCGGSRATSSVNKSRLFTVPHPCRPSRHRPPSRGTPPVRARCERDGSGRFEARTAFVRAAGPRTPPGPAAAPAPPGPSGTEGRGRLPGPARGERGAPRASPAVRPGERGGRQAAQPTATARPVHPERRDSSRQPPRASPGLSGRRRGAEVRPEGTGGIH
ncbi:collagen alpha-1(I) chain-like [Falco rusticolus]|uniref:collagen alpha-1(I) chain-like n=1 Tax=Falco rusticolus TaxID=120794 RepID=UPI00188682F4|nr:collagen alpha-1(I) chain-like [Falco rusticolus]